MTLIDVRKNCVMNCGPALGDRRTRDEIKRNCTDCEIVEVSIGEHREDDSPKDI